MTKDLLNTNDIVFGLTSTALYAKNQVIEDVTSLDFDNFIKPTLIKILSSSLGRFLLKKANLEGQKTRVVIKVIMVILVEKFLLGYDLNRYTQNNESFFIYHIISAVISEIPPKKEIM